NQYGGEKGELETGRTPKVQGLFLVRGVLLAEVADRLQALVEPLPFGLILRQENAVAGRRRRLALPARRHFAPILTIRHAVDEGVAREAAAGGGQGGAGI